MNHFPKSASLGIALLSTVALAPVKVLAAGLADFNKRVELVRIGDAEAQVRQLLDREPDRTQTTNILGVHKLILEFDAGTSQYELVFYGGHLVSKTSRMRKPTLLDKLSS